MIADIYIRVSTPQQAEGSGLWRQEGYCREWAARNNVTVRTTVKDVCSAYKGDSLKAESKNPNKGNLARYLRDMTVEDAPQLLLIEDADRLSRMDMFTNMGLLTRLSDLGIRVIQVAPWHGRGAEIGQRESELAKLRFALMSSGSLEEALKQYKAPALEWAPTPDE